MRAVLICSAISRCLTPALVTDIGTFEGIGCEAYAVFVRIFSLCGGT